MERTDLPLDLIVVADLLPPGSAGEDLRGRAHRVDRENLAEFMKQAGAALELPSGAAADGSPFRVRLEFPDFRAFRPEGLAAALPATRGLFALKRAIGERAPDAAGLRAAIETIHEPPELVEALRRVLDGDRGAQAPPRPAAAPPPPVATTRPPVTPRPASGGGIDALFDMVDVGGSAASETPSPSETARTQRVFDALVGEFVGAVRTQGTVPTATLRQIGDALDGAIAGTVRAALHHPRFQALERVWTALRWLTRRVDFRTGVRLHVVIAARSDLLAAFGEVVAPLAASVRTEGRVPLLVLDHAFDLGPDSGDFDDVAALAGEAEAVQLPVIAGLSPTVLGVPSLAQTDGLDDLSTLLSDDDHMRWNVLRALEASRWITLTINRFLLRAPYGAEQEKVKDFAFEENPIGADASYLWCGPPWAIAVLVAASFERTGWGTEIVGPDDRGVIGDLPVRPLRLRTTEVVQAPLEALLSERRVLELSQGGILALACRRNADAAFVASAPTLHRPATAEGQRPNVADARRASLPFQLFLAQIGALVAHLVAWMDRTRGPDEVASTLAKGLAFLTTAREGELVRVTVEGASAEAVALRVSPVAGPLRGLPDVAFEIPLGA
jgi:type VI secretion system protein ImpC